MEQVYEAAAVQREASGEIRRLQRLRNERAFTGAGPTIAVQASRRLGPAGLAVFGSARGSYVFGRYHEQARFLQDVIDPAGVTVGGSQATVTQATASRTTAVPVTELEVGAEYGQPFGRSRAFVRLSAVNQTYFDAGSASQVGGNVNLFGGRVALGLDY
ncbi:MAG: Lpg1974 family pore-forming outer membrane protein [Gemmataceae bacterium]